MHTALDTGFVDAFTPGAFAVGCEATGMPDGALYKVAGARHSFLFLSLSGISDAIVVSLMTIKQQQKSLFTTDNTHTIRWIDDAASTATRAL